MEGRVDGVSQRQKGAGGDSGDGEGNRCVIEGCGVVGTGGLDVGVGGERSYLDTEVSESDKDRHRRKWNNQKVEKMLERMVEF